jgi:CubicO group peptidase (beta-lactamase class C family)
VALAACVPLPAPPKPASGLVEPVFLPGGFEAEAFGRAEKYPIGTRRSQTAQRLLVGTLSHFDRVNPARMVPKPSDAWQFRRAPADIAANIGNIRYRHRGAVWTLNEYLGRSPVTGFLVLRDDEILFEQYRYGRHDAHRLTSYSMAKTIIAMLVGIAVEEGAIRSIDDPADAYVPGPKGSEYGATPIRALLHMSSGIAFWEKYDGNDGIAKLGRALNMPGVAVSAEAALAQFGNRVAASDTRFSHASAETMVLG